MGRHDHSRGPIDLVFHRGRLIFAFVVSQTLVFPIEHLLWTKVPPFDNIAHWFGL